MSKQRPRVTSWWRHGWGFGVGLVIAVLAGPVMAKERPRPPSVALQKRLIQAIQKTFKQKKLAGLSVGIVRGQHLIWQKHLGFQDAAKKRHPDATTLYRVGSVTKVFTSTLLAMLRDQGELGLDDALSLFFPEEVKVPQKPGGASAITLRHLATHTSGLPSLPPNVRGVPGDPYNDFSYAKLLEGLSRSKLVAPIGAHYSYSNMGFALLGHAMARAVGMPYPALVQSRLLDPLKMKDSCFVPSKKQRTRIAVGHNKKGKPVKAWKLGAFAPAGSMFSSLRDMARWVSFQLRAGQLNLKPVSGGTLREVHQVQRLLGLKKDGGFAGGVGLGWHVFPIKDVRARVVMHNGGVAGSRAFIGFVPEAGIGVVLLTNTAKFVDKLGFAMLKMLAQESMEQSGNAFQPRLQAISSQLCKLFSRPAHARDLEALFAPQFMTMLPRIMAMFTKMRTQFGVCKGFKLIPDPKTPGFAKAVFTLAKGYNVNLLLRIAEPDKGRLVYMLVRSVNKISPPASRPASKQATTKPPQPPTSAPSTPAKRNQPTSRPTSR